ncbi:MAG: CRISPR-associated protein Cmr5 [Methanosarcinales archaeon]|nr:CRISPR-associated protein Cmr5 [Methanosarcinales archaeon]
MIRTTKQQERAQKAYGCFSPEKNVGDDYRQFAKRFPALLHSCGLAQAVAFAQAKDKSAYLDDLSNVMRIDDNSVLGNISRTVDLVEYLQITREAIECATWIKRYAEATEELSEKQEVSPEK